MNESQTLLMEGKKYGWWKINCRKSRQLYADTPEGHRKFSETVMIFKIVNNKETIVNMFWYGV